MRAPDSITYDQALDKLGRRDQKKIGNNTYLIRLGDKIAIRYHQTHIVVMRRDGTYELDSGGWHTVTTKLRLNGYTPARIIQKKFEWFIFDAVKEQYIPFEDGLVVDSHGALVQPELKSYQPPELLEAA